MQTGRSGSGAVGQSKKSGVDRAKRIAEVTKAVDWKIFETQAALLEPSISLRVLDNAKLWLQQRHYGEIVEERANEGRCGYPCCAEMLPNGPPPAEPQSQYRINYRDKRIMEVDASRFYCSAVCCSASTIFESIMDSSIPASRPHAQELSAAEVPVKVDALLDILTLSPGAHRLDESKEEDERDDDEDDTMSTMSSVTRNTLSTLGTNYTYRTKSTGAPAVRDEEGAAEDESLEPPQFSNPQLSATGGVRMSVPFLKYPGDTSRKPFNPSSSASSKNPGAGNRNTSSTGGNPAGQSSQTASQTFGSSNVIAALATLVPDRDRDRDRGLLQADGLGLTSSTPNKSVAESKGGGSPTLPSLQQALQNQQAHHSRDRPALQTQSPGATASSSLTAEQKQFTPPSYAMHSESSAVISHLSPSPDKESPSRHPPQFTAALLHSSLRATYHVNTLTAPTPGGTGIIVGGAKANNNSSSSAAPVLSSADDDAVSVASATSAATAQTHQSGQSAAGSVATSNTLTSDINNMQIAPSVQPRLAGPRSESSRSIGHRIDSAGTLTLGGGGGEMVARGVTLAPIVKKDLSEEAGMSAAAAAATLESMAKATASEASMASVRDPFTDANSSSSSSSGKSSSNALIDSDSDNVGSQDFGGLDASRSWKESNMRNITSRGDSSLSWREERLDTRSGDSQSDLLDGTRGDMANSRSSGNIVRGGSTLGQIQLSRIDEAPPLPSGKLVKPAVVTSDGSDVEWLKGVERSYRRKDLEKDAVSVGGSSSIGGGSTNTGGNSSDSSRRSTAREGRENTGVRTVQWGASLEEGQSTTTAASATALKPALKRPTAPTRRGSRAAQPGAEASSHPAQAARPAGSMIQRPIVLSSGIVERPPANPSLAPITAPTAPKMSSPASAVSQTGKLAPSNSIMSGGVVERTSATVMSAAALRTKAEPGAIEGYAPVSSSASASSSAAGDTQTLSLAADANMLRPRPSASTAAATHTTSPVGREDKDQQAQQQQGQPEGPDMGEGDLKFSVAPSSFLQGLSVYPFSNSGGSGSSGKGKARSKGSVSFSDVASVGGGGGRSKSRGSSRGLDLGEGVVDVSDDDYDDGESEEERDELDDELEEEDDDDDDDDDGNDFETAERPEFSPPPASLFLQIYTSLEDIFGRCSPVLTKAYKVTSNATVDNFGESNSGQREGYGMNSRGDIRHALSDLRDGLDEIRDRQSSSLEGEGGPTSSQALSSVHRPASSAFSLFLERGITAAEKMINLPLFLTPAAFAEYFLVKSRLMACMDCAGAVPTFRTNIWALFGLLVVDGIVRRRQVLGVPNPAVSEGVGAGKREELAVSIVANAGPTAATTVAITDVGESGEVDPSKLSFPTAIPATPSPTRTSAISPSLNSAKQAPTPAPAPAPAAAAIVGGKAAIPLTARERQNQEQAARIARHVPLSPSASIVNPGSAETASAAAIAGGGMAGATAAGIVSPEAALRLWSIKIETVAHTLLDGTSGTLRDQDLAHLRAFWDDLV